MARASSTNLDFSPPSKRWSSAPAHMTGIALVAVSAGLLVSAILEAAFRDDDVVPLLVSSVVVGLLGGAMWRATQVPARIDRRDAFLSAVSVWFGISLAGAVPFRLSGMVATWELAVFESISGFTATGATVVTPIEVHGHGLLFFRQLTQWFGSMGMVVLAVAVLTFLGVGGMQLLSAEAPGPEVERLAPRVSETAKRLWALYLVLTGAGALGLMAVGLNPYDAVTHSMTGIATGGFSPHDASIAHFDSLAVEIVVMVIMFVGAVNFALMWRASRRRTLRPLLGTSEFRFYCWVASGSIAVVAALLVLNDGMTVGSALRSASFNVVSLMSTCGFATDDFVAWTPAAQLVLLFLMVTGGMAGSTSGAVKLFRVQVVLKHAVRELRRIRHPRAALPVRLGDLSVSEAVVTRILAFVMLYFLLAAAGVVMLAMLGADLATAAGSIATAMGGVGPGLGETGPASNFLALNGWQRVVMDLYMLFGRLEIVPVLAAGTFLLAPIPSRRQVRARAASVRSR